MVDGQMVAVGMKPESAYYESLHETPLIANTIARKKLYEMNKARYENTSANTCTHAHVPTYARAMHAHMHMLTCDPGDLRHC